jgi:hypothetical protein
MTDSTPALTPFEGTPVNVATVEIPNASGGLNDGLALDPAEFHHGATGVLIIEFEVTKVRFDPTKKGEPEQGLTRAHVLSATGAAFIDRDLVGDVLDQQAARIADHKAKLEAEKELAKGVKRLTGTAPDIEQHYDDGLDDFEPDRPGDDEDDEQTGSTDD